MHLRQPGFTLVLVDNLLKTKKEYKNLKKLGTKLVFIMTWLMEIFLEEQLLTYYAIKKLILLKIQNIL